MYFWLKTQIGFVQFSSQHFVNYISIWSVKLLAPMDYDHIFSLTLLFQSPMASKVLFSSASLPSFSPPPNLPNHFSHFTTLLLPHLDAPRLPYSGLLVLLPIEGGGPGGGQVGQPGSPLLQLLLLCGLPSLLDQGQQVCHLCTRAALGFITTFWSTLPQHWRARRALSCSSSWSTSKGRDPKRTRRRLSWSATCPKSGFNCSGPFSEFSGLFDRAF